MLENILDQGSAAVNRPESKVKLHEYLGKSVSGAWMFKPDTTLDSTVTQISKKAPILKNNPCIWNVRKESISWRHWFSN